MFTLEATPSAGKPFRKSRLQLRNEIAQLVKDGVNADELKRVKAQVTAGEVYKLDSLFYQAMRIGQMESIGLGHQAIPVMLDKLQFGNIGTSATSRQGIFAGRQFDCGSA